MTSGGETERSFFCHSCRARFNSSQSDVSHCPQCNEEFIEEIGESHSRPLSRSRSSPASTAAFVRISFPISPSTPSSTSESSSSPTGSGIPGFIQSILNIFSPSHQRGNGSSRRRPNRDHQEHPGEYAPSNTTRPRLSPPGLPALFSGNNPGTFAATFTTAIPEEDLNSPDGMQRFLISLFTQIYDTMSPSTGNATEASNQTDASTAETEDIPTRDETSAAEGNMNTPEPDSNTNNTRVNTEPTAGDIVRFLLQQVLSGNSPIQWVSFPAIPELLGDYVFGERAFDDVITALMEQAAGQRSQPPASQETIDSLPREKFHERDKEIMPDCSICREAFNAGDLCIMLPCKHLFHENCIVPWLQLNRTCPICRSSVETNSQLHQEEHDTPSRFVKFTLTQMSGEAESAWQQYIDDCLLGSGDVSQAAIFGHDGSKWASSPNFSISDAEVKALIAAFDNPSKAFERGIYIGGTRSIYGKNGSAGIVCAKTGQAVIIGAYTADQIPGNATLVVENLADYLNSSGF